MPAENTTTSEIVEYLTVFLSLVFVQSEGRIDLCIQSKTNCVFAVNERIN